MDTITTRTTCGFACWEAQEDICRCSCRGKNHGILRRGGERPERQSKIDGLFYVLADVGTRSELWQKVKEINNSAGPREESFVTATAWDKETGQSVPSQLHYVYNWRETDSGAPARLKPASRSQLKWEEFTGREFTFYDPAYILWLRQGK